MHYFVPNLCLPSDAPSRTLTDKFGGLPEGFPSRLWPMCADCGRPQSFSAQFDHEAERMNLGRPGRRLFLFQCAEPESVGGCETWDAASGSNAAIVIEPEDLTPDVTQSPVEDLTLENEVLVREWRRREDGIDVANAASYFSNEGRSSLSKEDFAKLFHSTKLGSVPAWVQDAEEADHAQWRFLGQLDSVHRFDVGGVRTAIDAANYGGGLAYVFVERTVSGGTPRALLFWQC
jgi:hypothetical protein